MTARQSQYRIHRTMFHVAYGDITRLAADILVSSDDSYLTMGGGVSASLLRAGGDVIAQEAEKHTPLKLGDVAVTSAGRLRAKYVFHVVTIEYQDLQFASAETLTQATARCLQLADALSARSIAFPALGTGVAAVPFHVAADAMTRSITDHLRRETRLETVTLTLRATEKARNRERSTFYERSVALASIASESGRLSDLFEELARIARARNRPDLLARIDGIRRELETSREMLSRQPETGEQADILQARSGVERIAQEAIALSSRPGGIDTWDDRELEAQVLRTKLAGLLTQLNIQMSHANRYEIEKARYGGQLVPPRLELAIDDLAKDMAKVEAQVRQTRAQLAEVTLR